MANSNKQTTSRFSASSIFNWALLAVCLCSLALRATFTQGIVTTLGLKDTIFDAAITTALAGSFCAWLLWNIRAGTIRYRFSGIEIGAALLAVGCLISFFFASNKRDVLSFSVLLIIPMLAAVLLIQLLDSALKIKILLYFIAALGAVNVVECADQYTSGNDMMLKQYQEDPNSMLARMNIEKDSFQHMLFEHRLFSKDIRGFFTTSNSASSFFFLSLAAALALVIEKRLALSSQKSSSSFGELVARILIALVIVAGIVLAHSKGAFAAILIVIAGAVFYRLLPVQSPGKKPLVFAAILLFVAAVASFVLISYGLKHNALPGGKSMLVRWEYWLASAKLIALNPLTGIGAGNFGTAYELVKFPGALETVKDPHNFIISLLAQVGPVGLLGFLLVIAALVYNFARPALSSIQLDSAQPGFKSKVLLAVSLTAALLIIVRPALLEFQLTNQWMVAVYIVFWLVCLPAAVFTGSCLMLSVNETSHKMTRAMLAVLFCGVAAVLVHNLVDFAIFEPGVYLALFTVIAVIIACRFNASPEAVKTITLSTNAALLAVVLVFASFWALLHFTIRPVIANAFFINKVMAYAEPAIRYADSNSVKDENRLALVQTSHGLAYKLLCDAVNHDPLSPDAPALSARLSVQAYNLLEPKDKRYLDWAHNQLLIAIERDSGNFNYYEKLAEVFELMAQSDYTEKAKTAHLNQALAAIEKALEYYPGSDRLHMYAGRLALKLDLKQKALAHFKTAVDIEDLYRREFMRMYPGRSLFSRLGETEYSFATQQVNILSAPVN